MKGILFTQENFQATIEGRKTMTRQIVKLPKWADGIDIGAAGKPFAYIEKYRHTDDARAEFIKPRYKVGEKVYLKESFVVEWYDKKNWGVWYKYTDYDAFLPTLKWNNPRTMAASQARYFIEITDVHCERLQDISDEDCYDEGIKINRHWANGTEWFTYSNGIESGFESYREAYASLIEKINGKCTWEKNPLVWVYSYKLVKI